MRFAAVGLWRFTAWRGRRLILICLCCRKILNKFGALTADLGYDIEGLPLSFNDGFLEIRRISKIDKESKTLFTIDFLLVTEGLKKVWETRENIDFEDDKVWTVSREGLIYMKEISGRHKDLGDIESLKELENES